MKRRLGFTLVELLVVIAIISLMISILLPALSGARFAAHRIVCLSQQRQIFLATAMYADDNDGYFPNRNTEISGENAYNHFNHLGKGGYLTDTSVYLCPSSYGLYPGPRKVDDWRGNKFEINIGFNLFLQLHHPDARFFGVPLQQMHTLVKPNLTMTVVDGHEHSRWPSWEPRSQGHLDAVDVHRHSRGNYGANGEAGLNLVYADGHGGTLSGSPAQDIVPARASSGPGAFLWLGAEGTN